MFPELFRIFKERNKQIKSANPRQYSPDSSTAGDFLRKSKIPGFNVFPAILDFCKRDTDNI